MKIIKLRREWRRRNQHNKTEMINIFDIEKVSVGNYTYGKLYVLMNNLQSDLKIGHFCSIAPEVVFILASDHSLNTITTFPIKVKILEERYEALSKGNIIIDDDVWIGYGSIILSGIHIGQGAVVAAGSIVTKDIPPYSIVAGTPARVIRYRFDEAMIQELLKIDFGGIDRNYLDRNLEDFYQPLIKREQLEGLPKR